MLLAGPLLGESVGWRRWVGAAIGFLGMLIIVRPGSALHPVGVMFVLLTVACNVVFQMLTRKLSTVDHSMTTIFLSALVGVALSVATLPLQASWGGWPAQVETRTVLLLLSMGVTGFVSQWCLIRAYYWSSASFIAPLVYLQIVWAALAGLAFFGQWPAPLSLIGIALICASGAGTVLAGSRSVQSGPRLRSSVDRASPS
ncbi:MAG: DMT family transporter [Burkholderiaceae bacterium]|nr:DMT family transporter [Burkholderiaceae bacterium]